LKIILGPSK